MSLYNNFAAYYDKIFPRNPKVIDFMERHFKKGHILDLACGSGEYSVSLAHLGYDVTGVDISTSMIEYAKDKAFRESVKVNFEVDDMLNLSTSNHYEGIICIGNSLVHLDTEVEVLEALLKMHKALKKEGSLIIQVINYDLILEKKLPGLSTVTNESYSFYRNYEFDGNKIHFKTRLTDGLRVFVDETLLLPLKYHTLVSFLEKVGFHSIDTFGGFTHHSFDLKEDITYVVTAKK
ncbi:MAG: methyltransferase domain-containing protein [Acholeplasma sp.]|nr:methyltransferase domain-containing protein [Acholeplasma sp.]